MTRWHDINNQKPKRMTMTRDTKEGTIKKDTNVNDVKKQGEPAKGGKLDTNTANGDKQ